MDSGELFPLLAAGGALLLIGLTSLIASAAEEEEMNSNARATAMADVAAREVVNVMVSLHHGGDELSEMSCLESTTLFTGIVKEHGSLPKRMS
jgi:hypothetical protein